MITLPNCPHYILVSEYNYILNVVDIKINVLMVLIIQTPVCRLLVDHVSSVTQEHEDMDSGWPTIAQAA